ncbi:putative ABC transporter permease [Candidatus Saccharibacteria bacterium]|nr:putative ABC transporter permease [Candidatus Saccharibacteria bacterium]
MVKVLKNPNQDWRRPQFWRNLFLYFWGFSFVGHIVEVFWALFGNAVGLRSVPASTIPLFSIAVPYGLGAVALFLLLYPLAKKKRIGPVMIFIAGALVTTTIEFTCAALLVAFTGHNYFWNYSDRFMNLYGYICLGNSLLFGLGSVVIVWWIFPMLEKILKCTKERYINIIFWILFIGYILSQIYLRILIT